MSNRPSSSSTAPTHPIAPTVPPAIHALAAPTPLLIDSQLPSYLIQNLLDVVRDSASHVIRKKRKEEDELREQGLLPPIDKGKGRASEEGQEEETRVIEEETFKRVERIGLMVGGYVAEKSTLARPPLATHLDIIKFICKDLFLYVYSKQIDNLRTNHRGVFVLQSHIFPPLMSLSSYRGAAADMEAARPHFVFPQALVQGALTRLGMSALVTVESSGLPQCTFQIRTVKSTQLPPTPSTIATAPGSGIPVPSATVPRPVSAVASAGTPTTAGTR